MYKYILYLYTMSEQNYLEFLKFAEFKGIFIHI